MKPQLVLIQIVSVVVASLIGGLLLRMVLCHNRCASKHRLSMSQARFRCGDLLLSRNMNVVTSTFGGSYWNHAAVVFECPHTGVQYAWDVCLPHLGFAGFAGARHHKGTRLRPVERYIEKWKGPIAVRRLEGGPDLDKATFLRFVEQRWNTGFAFDFVAQGANRTFHTLFSIPITARTSQTPRYCAELAAETYQHMGVLDKRFQSSCEIVPRDFAEVTENLRFVGDYRFGPELILEDKKPPRKQKKKTTNQAVVYCISEEDL